MDQLTCELYVQQMVEMILLAKVDTFLDLFSPGAEMVLPNAYCVGKDAIRTALGGMYNTYDSISIKVTRVVSGGNVVWIEWRWSDRNRLTGNSHLMDTALILEFENDRIRRWREYHSPVLGS